MNGQANDSEMRVEILGDAGIVEARQTARETARTLGFGVVDQSRIATAVSELARNVVRYATGGQGTALIRALPASERGTGIEIVIADDGPGIADTELVMRAGYTSSAGLGMGLPGTKRLMDEMDLDSVPGRGTTVTIRKWRR
jgi:serine/threonine-protein kinase RsbT